MSSSMVTHFSCSFNENQRKGIVASQVPVRNLGLAYYTCNIQNNSTELSSTLNYFTTNVIWGKLVTLCLSAVTSSTEERSTRRNEYEWDESIHDLKFFFQWAQEFI